jgi:hypothetical protein
VQPSAIFTIEAANVSEAIEKLLAMSIPEGT